MANHKWTNRCLPPDALEILADSLPDGYQWYELRTYSQRRCLQIDEYDEALVATKILKKVLPNATCFYCFVSKAGIEEIKIL